VITKYSEDHITTEASALKLITPQSFEMAETDALHKLKRKRTRERSNITRFSNIITSFTEETSPEDCEYYKDRIAETLERLVKLDDDVHDVFSDSEYDGDVTTSEEYIEAAKRAIQRASRGIENKSPAATAESTPNPTSTTSVTVPGHSITHSVKLAPTRLEPFSGDVETWERFWEQFHSSIDQDKSLSTINKQVFLRGYQEGKPKALVDGIAIMASTFKETKRILKARYGDRSRIIQAHLDYLENVKPIRFVSPEE
jgi:hypothetical protein